MSAFVKIDEVIKRDCFYIAKKVAVVIKEKTYYTPLEFFKNISQSDLDVIIDKLFAIRAVNDAEGKLRRQSDIVLLAMLLHIGEGKADYVFEEDEVDNAYQRFSKMAVAWQLHLEQPELIVHFSNFSFESDLPLFDKG